MSKNEGEPDIEDENLEDLPDENSEDYKNIDWKARAEKAEGIAKRRATKLAKLKEDGKEKPPVKKEGKEGKEEGKDDNGFDRIDRNILRSEKISDQDELDLVSDIMKETGKDVEGVLASKYFQSELKNLRDEKEAAAGTPKGTKRVANQSKSDVDYWIAKGELPPMSEPALRQKVVNAKIAREKNKNQFSTTPVIL